MTLRFVTFQVPRPVVLGLLSLLLCAILLASLAIGARAVPVIEVIGAFTGFDPENPGHLVVRDLREPRSLLGLLVGGALGVAGVLMQAMTRNPLADPGLLGVNAGSALAVVGAITFLGITATGDLVWFALAGAALVTVLVFALGADSRSRASPVRLVLAGAALTALLGSITQGILLTHQETLQVYRYWALGSLAGADMARITSTGWIFAVGVLLAAFIAPALNAVALGDDTAQALGVRMLRLRVLSLFAVTALSGGAVAAAGPVGFIGLVVPHLARWVVGVDQRWQMAAALLIGPALLLFTDILGRIVLPPGEIAAGIMVGLIGGPFFVWVVRQRQGARP